MARLIFVSVFTLTLVASGVARADDDEDAPGRARPHRAGFTMELGIGGAVTARFNRVSDIEFSSTGPDKVTSYYDVRILGGFAPLSFGIGGFLSENVALMFRGSGTIFYRTNDPAGALFYGPAVQIWASDALMFGAGLGLGTLSSDVTQGIEAFGVAASLRVSYAFFRREAQALSVGLEVIPGLFPDDLDITLGTAALLEWHLF